MGFMDEVSSGGGTKLLKFDGRAGNYVVRGSEATFNGQEFVVDVSSATGGFLKFKGKGEPPERHMGPIFPKDLAPARASLGDLDKSQWPEGKFGDEPEDPWSASHRTPADSPGNRRGVHLHRAVEDFACCSEGLPRPLPASTGGLLTNRPARRRLLQGQIRAGEETRPLDDW